MIELRPEVGGAPLASFLVIPVGNRGGLIEQEEFIAPFFLFPVFQPRRQVQSPVDTVGGACFRVGGGKNGFSHHITGIQVRSPGLCTQGQGE